MNDRQRTQVHDAMVRLARGDRDAFSIVFDGLWPHLLRFVTRATAGHPDSEDLAQQALLKLFARISDFDVTQDGVAWAFGIATYEVRTLRKRISRRRETGIDGAFVAAVPSPENSAIAGDLHDALVEALGELTRGEREVLIGEAANQSGSVTAATWRKRRQRALEKLRAVWSKRHA